MAVDTPLVSVVMPAYNAERWIGEAIESVLQQDYPNVELVVVEDGSSDRTLEVATEYADDERVRVISDGVNRGAPAARNHGVALARGMFVKFLDADDVLLPKAIGRQVAAAKTLEGVPDAIVFDDAEFGEAKRHILTVEVQADEAFSSDPVERLTYFVECSIPTPCPLHRRDVLLRVGGFRVDLKRAQEYDLHLRLAATGVRFKRVSHVGVWVREHDSPTRISNAQSGSRRRAEEANAIYRNHLGWRRLVAEAVGTPYPPRIARRFALEAWMATRHMVQLGRSDLARLYAEEAVALDPGFEQVESLPYQVLARLLDPIRAEKVLVRLRPLLGR